MRILKSVNYLIVALALTTIASDYVLAQEGVTIPTGQELLGTTAADTPNVFVKPESDFTVSTYLDGVAKKIEQVMFAWPRSELGQRVYGGVDMVFIIAQDGSLVDVYPRSASREKTVLVETASKIVRIAAPFAPPPQALLKGHKSVQFCRYFKFVGF